MSSFKAEVQADGSGSWAGNALRFATEIDAADYAQDLHARWTLVRKWRVVMSDDPVNVNDRGELISSTPATVDPEMGHRPERGW